MIRLKFPEDELQKIYTRAKAEERTVLGIIYNEYIAPCFPTLEVLNPRNIHANKELVLRMIELDRELDNESTTSLYLQYGPSTDLVIPLDADEMMAVL